MTRLIQALSFLVGIGPLAGTGVTAMRDVPVFVLVEAKWNQSRRGSAALTQAGSPLVRSGIKNVLWNPGIA